MAGKLFRRYPSQIIGPMGRHIQKINMPKGTTGDENKSVKKKRSCFHRKWYNGGRQKVRPLFG
jgi:hypothetical protein